METVSAEEAARNLLQLIVRAQQDNQQFRITSDQGTVIVLPEETYENLMVTLEVLSTPGLMNGLKLLQQPNDSYHFND